MWTVLRNNGIVINDHLVVMVELINLLIQNCTIISFKMSCPYQTTDNLKHSIRFGPSLADYK